MERLLNTKEIAEKLGLSVAQIYVLRKDGLPVLKIGNSARYDEKSVMDWIKQQNANSETGA